MSNHKKRLSIILPQSICAELQPLHALAEKHNGKKHKPTSDSFSYFLVKPPTNQNENKSEKYSPKISVYSRTQCTVTSKIASTLQGSVYKGVVLIYLIYL